MANYYFKDIDSYFKFSDETYEIICVTTNFTNKCVAISSDTNGGYQAMKSSYIEEPTGIISISEELFEAKRDEVRQYIIENL